jgi:hypothetical protein
LEYSWNIFSIRVGQRTAKQKDQTNTKNEQDLNEDRLLGESLKANEEI